MVYIFELEQKINELKTTVDQLEFNFDPNNPTAQEIQNTLIDLSNNVASIASEQILQSTNVNNLIPVINDISLNTNSILDLNIETTIEEIDNNRIIINNLQNIVNDNENRRIEEYNNIYNDRIETQISRDEENKIAFNESLKRLTTDAANDWWNEPLLNVIKEPISILKEQIPNYNKIKHYYLIDSMKNETYNGNPIDPIVTNITVEQALNNLSNYTLDQILDTNLVRDDEDINYQLSVSEKTTSEGNKFWELNKPSRKMFAKYIYWKKGLTGLYSNVNDISTNAIPEGPTNQPLNKITTILDTQFSGTYPDTTEPYCSFINLSKGINDISSNFLRRPPNMSITYQNIKNSNESRDFNKILGTSIYENFYSRYNDLLKNCYDGIEIIAPTNRHNINKINTIIKINLCVPTMPTWNGELEKKKNIIENDDGNLILDISSDNIGFYNPLMEMGLGENQSYDRNFMIYDSNDSVWKKIPIGKDGSIFYNYTGFFMYYGSEGIYNNLLESPQVNWCPVMSYLKYSGELLNEGIISHGNELPIGIHSNNKIFLNTESNYLFRYDENQEEWIQLGKNMDLNILKESHQLLQSKVNSQENNLSYLSELKNFNLTLRIPEIESQLIIHEQLLDNQSLSSRVEAINALYDEIDHSKHENVYKFDKLIQDISSINLEIDEYDNRINNLTTLMESQNFLKLFDGTITEKINNLDITIGEHESELIQIDVRLDQLENETIPTATNEILGGIKVGENLDISGGVLSAVELTDQEIIDIVEGSVVNLSSGSSINSNSILTSVEFNQIDTRLNDLMMMIGNVSTTGGEGGEGSYTLPTATNEILGGIKVGENLDISGGVLSAVELSDQEIIDIVEGSVVNLSSGSSINSNSILTSVEFNQIDTRLNNLEQTHHGGAVSTTGGEGGEGSYTLPTASDKILGGIKVGENLDISGGVLSLSTAIAVDTINEKTSAHGVVIDSVSIKDGSITAPYNISAGSNGTVTAANFNVGSKNVISASAQGSFTDMEIKNNGNTGVLAFGETGDMHLTGILKVDDIQEKTSSHGVEIAGVTIKNNGITAGSNGTISASNFNVGSKNVISASAQGSFTDMEIKNNGNTGVLAFGETGDMHLTGILKVDDIQEKIDGSGVTIDGVLMKDNNITTSSGKIICNQLEVNGVSITQNGGGGGSYTLPAATSSALGGIKVGNNLNMTDGVLTAKMGGVMTGHIIPDTNAAYDLGNAEYKIRHLFLSDNSLWVGDSHKISSEDGKMKFKKRKADKIPQGYTGNETPEEILIELFGENHDKTLEDISLLKWLEFANSKGLNVGVQELFNESNDFEMDHRNVEVYEPQLGDMTFYDGNEWKRIPIGTEGETLKIVNGVPSWV